MLFCNYCGTRLPNGSQFCHSCGRQQQKAREDIIAPLPLIDSGQLPAGNVGSAPLVQGTPQTSVVPSVQNTPPMLGNASSGNGTSSQLHQASHLQAQHHAAHHPEVHHRIAEHSIAQHATSGGVKLAGHLSRRAVLVGLVGGAAAVAVASGGIAWAVLSKHPQTSSPGSGTLLPTRGGSSTNTAGSTSTVGLVTPGTWSLTGSMSAQRVGHSITLLQDGKVLVAGGIYSNAQGVVPFSEVYDPATGLWTRAGNLNFPRYTQNNMVVTLPNGKALIAGGADISNNDYASAELYDPATGSWSATGDLNTPRRGATLTLLKDGRAFIAAGARGLPDGNRFLASCELYDPTKGTWTLTGNMAVARENSQRAVRLLDGRVLVAGGEGPWYVYGDTAELYDPTTGSWSSAGTMPWGWSGASMTTLTDGRVLVAGGGGTNTTSAAALYNPATGTWKSTAPMSLTRVGHTATLLADGRVLVAGGGSLRGREQSSEFYDPRTETWSVGPNLHEPRVSHVTIALPKSVLTAGGIRSDPSTTAGVLASCELFGQ